MKYMAYLLFFILLFTLAACSPEVSVPEEPALVGHIVEVSEKKQIIFVVEDITKEEAMEIDFQNYELGLASFASNGTVFEGAFKKGDKVAVWNFDEGPENADAIAERIVLLGE